MTTKTCRLEAPGLDPLDLTLADGWLIQALDLGDAATREVVEDAPDADGTIDTTAFIGARAITLEVIADPLDLGVSKLSMVRRLRAFTHPKLRPTMYLQLDPADPEMQITLRRSNFTYVENNDDLATIVAQWIAPLGIFESAALHDEIVYASGGGLISGLGFDWSFDLDFGNADPIGTATITNAGSHDAFPLLRIYGPCTDPSVQNTTQGKGLYFTGLTILAGEFLEVDTRSKTVRYEGNPADSRYDTLDFTQSSWWTLSPGDNEVVFEPATYSSPSQCHFVYRDAGLA